MKKTIEKDRRMELFMEEKDMNQKKKPDDPAEQETGRKSPVWPAKGSLT